MITRDGLPPALPELVLETAWENDWSFSRWLVPHPSHTVFTLQRFVRKSTLNKTRFCITVHASKTRTFAITVGALNLLHMLSFSVPTCSSPQFVMCFPALRIKQFVFFFQIRYCLILDLWVYYLNIASKLTSTSFFFLTSTEI